MATFCSKCNGFCSVDYGKKQAVCMRCGHIVEIVAPPEIKNVKLIDEKIVVINTSHKKLRSLPIRRCLCPKCGNKEAYVSMVGSRSEEDYETERYRCTACTHSWRENS